MRCLDDSRFVASDPLHFVLEEHAGSLTNCLPALMMAYVQWLDGGGTGSHTSHNYDLSSGPIHVEFFKGGRTNICFNVRWVLPCWHAAWGVRSMSA